LPRTAALYTGGAAGGCSNALKRAINGVQQTAPNVMRLAGVTASFEEAEAELRENWAKWLAWAKLQEISE
jgi:hypothetical protein